MKKSAYKICFAALALLLASLTTFAQIRIPRIPKPRPNPPTTGTPAPSTPTPNTSAPDSSAPPTDARRPGRANNQQAAGQLYEAWGNYIDDGFTWFESIPTNDLDEKHLSVPTGWTLNSSVRLMGVYPKHSAFKFVVSRAGKVLGTTRCEASAYNTPPQNTADVSFIFRDGCSDKAAATKETGKFDVEVFLIDGNTNAETSLRKYKIEVIKVDRVNGQIGKFAKPDSPRYVVSRHAEAPVSVLYLRPGYALDYVANQRNRTTINQVEIYYNLSPNVKGVPDGVMRCSVDGKRLQFPGEGLRPDLARTTEVRFYEEIYSDRIAAPYSAGGPAYKDDISFRLESLHVPLAYGVGAGVDQTRLNLKDYPGNWECSLVNNGEVYRTWRWRVGADGMPVKHAEQQQGNINLHPNAYLIETEIPAGGAAIDKRLAPVSATEGLFYGQRWTSAEGKAMATKVPTKGSPAPVPSNKVK